MLQTTVEIPNWLAKANGIPRFADITVHKKTSKAVFVSGHGMVDSPIYCMNCGKDLTHPISQMIGIGPICCEKLGIDWHDGLSLNDIEKLRESLRFKTKFENTCLPLSKIKLGCDLSELDNVPDLRPKADLPEFREGQEIEFEVTDWIRKTKRITERCFSGVVEYVTPKAIKVCGTFWPKSQITSAKILKETMVEEESKEGMEGMTFAEIMEAAT